MYFFRTTVIIRHVQNILLTDGFSRPLIPSGKGTLILPFLPATGR